MRLKSYNLQILKEKYKQQKAGIIKQTGKIFVVNCSTGLNTSINTKI